MSEYQTYSIVEIRDECKETKTFVLDKGINAKPGNFVMIWLPGIGEKPISISSGNPLELTLKKFGIFTSALFELKKGSTVWIRGPYGNSFLDFTSNASKKYIVAGGTGAAPLAFLVDKLKENRERPTIFLGVRNKESVIFEKRFRQVSNLFIATSDGSYETKGFATELFKKVDIENSNSQFFICGPEKMMLDAAQKAMKYVNPENIFLSLERYMKCGCGICGGCEMSGLRICVDGPVFSYKTILECEDFGKYKRDKTGKKVEL